MVRTFCTVLLTAALGSTALAAGDRQPAQMPASPPAMQDTDTTFTIPAAPAVPLARPFRLPGMSPMQLIDAMSGIKGSPDGTQTEIGVSPRLKRMLMRPQQGMIGGGTQENKGNLKPISNTGQYPYTTIGKISNGCTGTLVNKRFVLTSAWCVYDLKGKTFWKDLDFLPAMNGKNAPFGRVKWKNAFVTKIFAEKGDFNYGYGLIELQEEIGDKTGWFGFAHQPNFEFKKIAVTGYPGAGVPEFTMWQSTCRIDTAEQEKVFYRCSGNGDALSSMIGSPMWFKGKGDADWYVVGIHVTAQTDQKNSFWASRISSVAYKTLDSWINDGGKTGKDDKGDDDEIIDDGDDKVVDDTGDDTDLIDDEDVADNGKNGKDDEIVDDGGDNAKCTCDDQTAPK